MSIAALGISMLSAVAGSFSALNSSKSAQSAVAQVRPVLLTNVAGPIKVGNEIEIPLRIFNAGKTRACIDSVQLVIWRDRWGRYSYLDLPGCEADVIRSDQSVQYHLWVKRYYEADGGKVDVSRGADSARRLDIIVRYHGIEVDSRFEESLLIPVAWAD